VPTGRRGCRFNPGLVSALALRRRFIGRRRSIGLFLVRVDELPLPKQDIHASNIFGLFGFFFIFLYFISPPPHYFFPPTIVPNRNKSNPCFYCVTQLPRIPDEVPRLRRRDVLRHEEPREDALQVLEGLDRVTVEGLQGLARVCREEPRYRAADRGAVKIIHDDGPFGEEDGSHRIAGRTVPEIKQLSESSNLRVVTVFERGSTGQDGL
jgi:hypothetical protein